MFDESPGPVDIGVCRELHLCIFVFHRYLSYYNRPRPDFGWLQDMQVAVCASVLSPSTTNVIANHDDWHSSTPEPWKKSQLVKTAAVRHVVSHASLSVDSDRRPTGAPEAAWIDGCDCTSGIVSNNVISVQSTHAPTKCLWVCHLKQWQPCQSGSMCGAAIMIPKNVRRLELQFGDN